MKTRKVLGTKFEIDDNGKIVNIIENDEFLKDYLNEYYLGENFDQCKKLRTRINTYKNRPASADEFMNDIYAGGVLPYEAAEIIINKEYELFKSSYLFADAMDTKHCLCIDEDELEDINLSGRKLYEFVSEYKLGEAVCGTSSGDIYVW